LSITKVLNGVVIKAAAGAQLPYVPLPQGIAGQA